MATPRFCNTLLAGGLIVLTACGQAIPEIQEPEPPRSPLGSWSLSEVTNIDGTSSGGPSSNECQVADVPLMVDSLQYAGAWHVVLGVGGTIRCEVDGTWGPATAYGTYREMWASHAGDSVRMGYPDLDRWDYVGVFTDSDTMEGRASRSGRIGTWRAVRTAPAPQPGRVLLRARSASGLAVGVP